LEQIKARAGLAVPGAELDIVPTEIRDSRRNRHRSGHRRA